MVLGFGGVIAGIGVFAVLMPAKLRGLAIARLQPRVLPRLVVVRLLVGSTLVVAAGETRFPEAFRVIGAVIVLGALMIPIIGWSRITAMVEWISLNLSVGVVRVGGLFAIGLGAFFMYAVR